MGELGRPRRPMSVDRSAGKGQPSCCVRGAHGVGDVPLRLLLDGDQVPVSWLPRKQPLGRVGARNPRDLDMDHVLRLVRLLPRWDDERVTQGDNFEEDERPQRPGATRTELSTQHPPPAGKHQRESEHGHANPDTAENSTALPGPAGPDGRVQHVSNRRLRGVHRRVRCATDPPGGCPIRIRMLCR